MKERILAQIPELTAQSHGRDIILIFKEDLGEILNARRKVTAASKVPKNWASFLRLDENKTELFSFLSEKVTTIRTEEKVICATKGINVVCNSESDCTSLMPCFQEEADGRIFLHVQNMVKLDLQKVMVVSVDSDVVVLAVSVFHEVDMDELWVSYGTGINKKYIPVHEIAASLGPFKARVLPLFHSLTGCDTTSGFKYKGEKKCMGYMECLS